MADPVLLILLVIHVSVAATAFGIGLSAGGTMRRATGKGRDVKELAAQNMMRTGQLSGIFGILTLLSGLALIFYMGGFKVVAPTIHAGMGIVILMTLHGALIMRPIGNKIMAAVDKDDATWKAALKPYMIGHGVMQLMWLSVLVLMFIKRG